MLSLNQVEQQLKRIGCNFRFWGRGEIRELAKVLMPDEVIAHIANGWYEGGFGLLAATDQRLLLIDRKPMFIAVEDLRFDMVAELDFTSQLLSSTLKIVTPNRVLRFSTWSPQHLREILNVTQARMMELRQGYARSIPPIMMGEQLTGHIQTGLMLGGLALQTGGTQRPLSLPLNPYNQTPLLVRRRHFPNL